MTISECLPILNHFICGYSLKVGTVFTAWLGLAVDVLELVISVVYFLTYGKEIPDWELLFLSVVGGSAISASVFGLLLYGAYKMKPSFMVPYLILGMLSIISSSISIIVLGMYAVSDDLTIGLSIFLAGGLIVTLSAYLWLVVYSYYRQLQKCSLPQHQGSVETVLTVAESGEDYMSHHKFLPHGKCDREPSTVTSQTESN